jgi:hypothetical protein
MAAGRTILGIWLPALTDPRLRDFQFLCQPISHLYPLWGRLRNREEVAITVANRLANLTWRLERSGYDQTCEAARWYLSNLKDIEIVPVAEPIVKPLIDRLWRAIHEHEARVGYECDTGRFARLIGSSAEERYAVLFGPPFLSECDRSFLSSIHNGPRGDLIGYISLYCWHSIYSI